MKLGIDLGGTKIEIIALATETNQARYSYKECYRKRINTPQGDYQQTINAIVELVLDAESLLKQQGSVGIGIPGAICAKTQLVKNANSTCLIGKPLQADLEQKLQRPIRMSNDANCMVLSEAIDGAASDVNNVFGVIIGTGTGGAIGINQQIIAGANLIAGEWGHNPLPWFDESDLPDIDCYCGKKNCIETYLSGPGLINRYRLQGGTAETVQEILAISENNKHPEQLLAEKALQNYENQLAKSLASVINILDPDKIVLAGGMSNIQRLYQTIPQIWQQFVFSEQVTTQLVAAKHGDSSGVRGAAWLW